LARLMNNFANYDIHIEETHHIHKLDSPSGTAVSLAQDIIEMLGRKSHWSMDHDSESDSLLINSKRIGEVTGDHEVIYESEADRIVLKHEAKNRKGFALGAILAASWIIHQRGVFTMKDMIRQLSQS
jgi:4-hydroxy-tetrahydrodipicolinate reductase